MKRVMLSMAMVLLFTSAGFALQDNSITSATIAEADGTSGQNTNAGSGIKAGHIQDGAVTSGKLADGAVTDAKIGGAISVSKLQTYSNVRIVHKGATDGINTFNSVGAALNSISDASEGNPYTVYVMSGVYNDNVAMKPWVTIKGSGHASTVIASANLGATFTGADNATVEDLTMKNINVSTNDDVFVFYSNGTSSTIRNCHLIGSGRDTWTVYINGGNPVIENSIISAWGGMESIGIYFMGTTTASIKNTKISAQSFGSAMGVYVSFSQGAVAAQIEHSALQGNYAYYEYGANNLKLAFNQIEGYIYVNNSFTKFFNNYNADFVPVP